jgi:protein-S-isoprenylcysteine O-methyltransferase Ste14
MDATARLSASEIPASARLVNWLMDYGERALLVMLYLLLVQRLLPSLKGQPANVLLLASESIVVSFVVFRRRTANVTQSPFDWLVALGGTICPLLMQSGGHQLGPPALSATLMLVGICIHVGAKLSLRRSFGMAAANRGVKIGGLYRLVRHPMYLGYAVTWIGFLLTNPIPINLALVGCAGGMQVMRILAEERLLSLDETYRAFMARVRFRVLPGVF